MEPSTSAAAREQGNSQGIDQEILSRIQHLDLTKNIIDRSQRALAYGGYSEVFKGILRRDGCTDADVAIKRLRFHVDETKVKKASPPVLLPGVLVSS